MVYMWLIYVVCCLSYQVFSTHVLTSQGKGGGVRGIDHCIGMATHNITVINPLLGCIRSCIRLNTVYNCTVAGWYSMVSVQLTFFVTSLCVTVHVYEDVCKVLFLFTLATGADAVSWSLMRPYQMKILTVCTSETTSRLSRWGNPIYNVIQYTGVRVLTGS